MFKIRKGFADKDRASVASLYVAAFKSKFVNLIGKEPVLQKLFEQAVDPAYCLCAYDEQDTLVGIAGFHEGDNGFVDMKSKDFIATFGWLKGMYKAIVVDAIFTRKPQSPKEFLMDGIAVAPNSRGQGVGTQLFDALMQYGEKNGYTYIKLDVIDENPRAKALYERLGFLETRYEKVPKLLAKRIGVSGVSTMVKELKGSQ